jgi:predicted secreted protein
VQEAAAQAFAMDFLMPVELVNHLWKELRLPRDIEPVHAYQLSLFLGASYQAMVYQLANQGRLSHYQARRFLRVPPKQIKLAIGDGPRLDDSWADVWYVDESFSGQHLSISLNDEIRIELPEMPSTGYIWTVDPDVLLGLRPDTDRDSVGSAQSRAQTTVGESEVACTLVLVQDTSGSPIAEHLDCRAGIQGTRRMVLRAAREGLCELRLSLSRPWQRQDQSLKLFTLAIQVQGRPTGEVDRGYPADYRDDLAVRRIAA